MKVRNVPWNNEELYFYSDFFCTHTDRINASASNSTYKHSDNSNGKLPFLYQKGLHNLSELHELKMGKIMLRLEIKTAV